MFNFRFSSLTDSYLRERREERSRYIQRKKVHYASSRKSRYFAHMDYAVRSNWVGNSGSLISVTCRAWFRNVTVTLHIGSFLQCFATVTGAVLAPTVFGVRGLRRGAGHRKYLVGYMYKYAAFWHKTNMQSLIGPIPWGHSGPLCHALSSLSLWTSHAACAIAIAGVRLATPGDWQCNGGSQ